MKKTHTNIPKQITIAFTAFLLCIFTSGFSAFSDTDKQNTLETETARQPEPTNEQKALAQSHFLEGEAFFQAGTYKEAAVAFTLAYETLPHYSVLANIGLAYERAGAYPEAVQYFRKYLKALEERGEENSSIEALLGQTLARVAELEVSTDGFSEDCQILVDGIIRGKSPVQVIVFPGVHRIRVVRDGQTQIEEQLSIAAGETRLFTVTEISANSPVTANRLSQKSMSDEKSPVNLKLRTPFRIAVVSSVGTGITAGVLWGAALGTKYRFDNTDSIDEKKELRPKGERLVLAATIVSVAAGAVALTATVIGIVRNASSRKMQANAVTVTVLPGMAGIDVRF